MVKKFDTLLIVSMLAILFSACSPAQTQSLQTLITTNPEAEPTMAQVSLPVVIKTPILLATEVVREIVNIHGNLSTESPAPVAVQDLASSGSEPIFEITRSPMQEGETKKAMPEGNALVSSSGQQVSLPGGGGKPGAVSGSNPNQAPPEPSRPVSWIVYTDEAYHFSISYPDFFTILPEYELSAAQMAGLVHRVRFQDKQLLNSEAGRREPAQFTIDVFQRGTLPLEQWALSFGGQGELQTVNIGNLVCIREQQNTLMAPNIFYYCASTEFWYRLTPLGMYSEDMLRSFKVLP